MDKDTFVIFKPDSVELVKGQDGNDRFIGGYCSTEAVDRQGEVVFQKGLNFSEFIDYGYFNDNHNQKTAAVLGAPDRVRYDLGKGWYTEGSIFKTRAGDEIVELAKALKQTKRKLGFSIEGKIQEREGNKIKKALIRNVAITANPVNVNCSFELLGKAFTEGLYESDLAQYSEFAKSDFVRALVIGNSSAVYPATQGGAVLGVQDLEHDKAKKKAKKGLEPGEVTHVYKCGACTKGFVEESDLDDHVSFAHRQKSATLKVSTFEVTDLVRTRKGLMTAQEAVRLVKSSHPDWADSTCVRAARFALLRISQQKGGEKR